MQIMIKLIIKRLYSFIPFKKYIFTAIKWFYLPNESIYQHLHFNDWFIVKIDERKYFKIYNSTIIENEIFWNGLFGKWEKESLKVWLKLCENSQSILDIGANTGIYSILAKTLNSNAQVFAFEPHPYFFSLLQKNKEINQQSFTALQLAATNLDGDLDIEDYSGKLPIISVKGMRLDTFFEMHMTSKIDLIKLVVENNEQQVLEGYKKYIEIHRPTILIEVLNSEIAKQINSLLPDNVYIYFSIDESKGLRRTERLEKSDGYNCLICTTEVAKQIQIL